MPTHAGAPKDGRLNLEQQKKRAKELLAAFNAGGAAAQARFTAHGIATPKLADAQFVIARENGFPSWPKLKAHCEALALARAAMSRAPDAATTLHIRCGTDIERTLRDAGFAGRFHEFSDPFCQGPVRDLPREAFLAERARFLASAYDTNEAEAREAAAYAIFDELSDFTSIVLWFEHDSYDQLILAFILSEFATKPNLPPVHLICTDDVPGVSRFVGLGQLSPEVIRWLWSSQREIGAEHFAFGRKVWRAITNPDPRALHAIAAATPLIPQMSRALMRHLMELPSTHNGLSLTQQLALETIAAQENSELRQLFAPYGDREPLPFLGDTMFADIVEQMARASDAPLTLSPAPDAWRRTATLTDTGRALLANERDWLSSSPPPRWVGGVEIKQGRTNWRFDHATRSIAER